MFGPGSMMWTINRESVLLIGGRAALLMQLAHPLVAAGVADHSDFRSDPTQRLQRTLDAMLGITFGDRTSAEAIAARVRSVHAHVQGSAPDGRTYSARDPRLLSWVYCTLVDSSLRVYEACVSELSDEDRARYYDESRAVARLFQIPEEHIPASVDDMRASMRGRMASGEVAVTPLARDLAAPIINPLPLVPQRLARSADFVTPALLPRPIREGYGLRTGPPSSLVLALGRGASKLIVPRLPRRIRTWPVARKAEG
jgi:uncharacterized protein (DUF2236 family)